MFGIVLNAPLVVILMKISYSWMLFIIYTKISGTIVIFEIHALTGKLIRIIYIRIKRFKNGWKTIFWNNLAHHLTSRVFVCSFKLLISFYPIKITFLLTFYVNFVKLGPKNAVYPYVSVRKSSLSKLSEKVHYLKTQQKKLYMKSSAFNRSTWKNKCL